MYSLVDLGSEESISVEKWCLLSYVVLENNS